MKTESERGQQTYGLAQLLQWCFTISHFDSTTSIHCNSVQLCSKPEIISLQSLNHHRIIGREDLIATTQMLVVTRAYANPEIAK